MRGYLALKAWPDVPDALRELKRSGKQLALLSNVTPQILHAGIENSALNGISTCDQHGSNRILQTRSARVSARRGCPRAAQRGGESLIELVRFLGEPRART
jgi:hypothetical protein